MIGEGNVIANLREAGASGAGGGAGEETGRHLQFLFRVGSVLCAVPAAGVNEVMRPLPIEPLAGAPAYVPGVCIIRGAPVPVVDVGMLVAGRPTACKRLLSVRTGSRSVALMADDVLGLVAIDAQKLGQLPPLLRDAGTETIAAVGMLDAELLFLLQTGRIVPEELFSRLQRNGADA